MFGHWVFEDLVNYGLGVVKVLGWMVGVRTVLAVLGGLSMQGVRWVVNRRILRAKQGRWAIITGATDGIGLGIAREMARVGINLVLISRTEAKLKEVAKELSKLVEVKIVVIDFTMEVDFSRALSGVRGLEIDILVNNVGINGSKPMLYTEHSLGSERDIIEVNLVNTLKITREYISWESTPRSKKYVLSVGSMLGWMPSPYQQIYAGTKAFLQLWSESVQAEGSNYHFEVLMTGLVCSKLSGAKRPGFFVPSADTYGRCCVHAFGAAAVTYAYIPHAIQAYVLGLLPRAVIGLASNRVAHIMRAKLQAREDRAKKAS
ncbi:17beta-estradiol 17-dehydrogenase / very-long-chain 3-oxoacyl-CoA reductase [Nematocida homosporus]|uniref:17beta-estradiol 17-dehydrogenase / very-long-chain 3-oxoacyl-CoA reductase n=1 Tax=Nematocida homosporus TaxID=1912981 RepID=UPI00221E7076|nr:17beta-estradiol 17-dehydrogenase / very-long-chain 3-oxoacyl-CoA reductase [Nematocida homosporus]KAI5186819.1 17beta-estradiol 17-dehydrogenase / very-long-chain 3-oxoacyl-CoA reductase [Nematocida homosporus]